MKAKPVFESMHVSSQSLSIPCLSNGQVRFFLLISPKSYDHDRKNIQIHTKVQAAGEFVLDCPPTLWQWHGCSCFRGFRMGF